jgi:hypothetical protein
MTVTPNPAATGHLPFFITPPGQTDVLFHVTAWFVLLAVIGLGVLFFTIHSLPERIAHRTKKIQLDLVAVLCLLALLSHEHVFWVAALLLAFIDLPDFLTPVQRIATAAEKIAGQEAAEEIGEAGASMSDAARPAGAETEGSADAPPKGELTGAARQPGKGRAHA